MYKFFLQTGGKKVKVEGQVATAGEQMRLLQCAAAAAAAAAPTCKAGTSKKLRRTLD